MNAVVKKIFSTDVNIDSYHPNQSNTFGIWLRIIVSPKDEDGEEIFDVFVCTPEWIKSNTRDSNHRWCRHMLIVFYYNIDVIKSIIQEKIENINANNWNELALKISRYFFWEFEDYTKFNDI